MVVPNSEESEWLYVIKSGSCEVMKHLKGLSAKQLTKKEEKPSKPNRKLPIDYSLSLPKLGTGAQCKYIQRSLPVLLEINTSMHI